MSEKKNGDSGGSAFRWRLLKGATGGSGGQLFRHEVDGKRWLVKVFVGRDGKGRKKYLTKVVHGTRRDADAVRLEMLNRKAHGQLRPRASLTLAELVERWVAQKGMTVSARTLSGYQQLLNRHVLPVLGQKRVSRLEAHDFELLYRGMLDGSGDAVPLSPRTIRLTHAAINQALKYAVSMSAIPHNPVAAVALPRRVTSERPSLAADELQRFLAACEESGYGAFYQLLVRTGVRPGEACALTWADIDFEKADLKVTKTVTRGEEGQQVIAQPKTKRSNRTVPLMQSLVAVLKRHRALQEQRGHAHSGLVFTNESGGMLKPWTFNKRDLRRVVESAGILKPVSLYTLRHTFATSHLDTGTPLKQVSAWMGHSSINQTADTYMHASDDTGQRWMEKHEAQLTVPKRHEPTNQTEAA